MPLNFLVPAFLAGLAAIAIPVLVHLSRKQNQQAVEFPSLMFLQQIQHRTVKRRRIRNWLLLALRCAALAIIVAAFARPFLDREEAAATPLAGGREVVVLLDRSYSMGYGDRWERARRAAGSVLDGLGVRDRATLVLFDDRAAAVTEATSDRGVLRAALGDARVGSGTTRYASALKLAESRLAASPLPRREVVLISDFQKAGWEGAAGIRLPQGTTVTPVQVSDAETSNLAVTGVTFQREVQAGRERVTATARLVNKGSKPVQALPVVLEMAGHPVETRPVSLAANQSATVSFAPFTLAQANTRGAVRAGSDALAADNTFNFVLSPGAAINVLVLESPATRGEASLYLQRALEIGTEPGYRVEVRRTASVDPSLLAGRDVVILNDAPFPTGEAGRRLRALVERGAGVVALLGPSSRAQSWDGVGADMLPCSVGEMVDQSRGGGAALGQVDYSHPVFEPFRGPRSGDLSAARFFAYHPLSVAGSARALARFGDGSVALAERRVGRGKVLVWGSTLDNSWNDMALQPVFLPFVQHLVKHASGHAPPRPWLTVGEVLDGGAAAEAEAGAVVVSPAGRRMPLRAGTPFGVEEQGFYEVRPARAGAGIAQVVAANVDAAESDLTSFAPEEVGSALAATRTGRPAGATLPELTLAEREKTQSLWWYLLIGACLLLALETTLSNRVARASR